MAEKYDLKAIKKKLKKNLDEKRYKHTKNVAEVARCMAMSHGINIEKAYIAGFLHDCAKCFSDTEKYNLCDKYGVNLTADEVKNTALIHAKLGPYVAMASYSVEDPEILSAIAYHTTGREDMTLLEKIIYIADYIEPGRPELPRIKEVRIAAFKDIDRAMAMITEDSLRYLEKKGGVIDPNTKKAYDFYNKETNQ